MTSLNNVCLFLCLALLRLHAGLGRLPGDPARGDGRAGVPGPQLRVEAGQGLRRIPGISDARAHIKSYFRHSIGHYWASILLKIVMFKPYFTYSFP